MTPEAAARHPRNLAKAKGDKFYQTGKPCRRCGSTGLRYAVCGRCCACQRERNRTYSAQYTREYKRAQCKKFHDANPEYELLRGRRRAGLPSPTRPDVGVCECCGAKREDLDRSLSLDHCRETGIFRGWLCGGCNLSIGKLGDTVEGVQQALDYLKRAYGEANV